MDPLSVTASVVALSQAASAIISICYDFRAAIKDSPWALTSIISSVNQLRLILTRLEQVADDSETSLGEADAARVTAWLALCGEGGAISDCLHELTALEKKLSLGNWAGRDGSKRRAFIQSVGWQFKGKDAEETLQRLERYKSTLSLTISIDQVNLIKGMSKTMTNVDGTTRSMFEQFQDITFGQRRRSILQWLSTVDPSTNHRASLQIRQAGTNDWFLSHKEFESWSLSENSLLWLSGFPGSGKTILMSTLIDFVQKRDHAKNQTSVAYFYCDFRNPEARDPINLAGSLLAQICFKLGSYPASLESAFDRSERTGSPFETRISLDTVIETILEITSKQHVTIIIDGLDECEKRQDILNFFQKLAGPGKLLRILVSSRDESDIREALCDFRRVRLESASSQSNRDIDSYITYRLSHDREFMWLKRSFRETIQHRLSAKAKGMFRWAQCQVDQISKLKTMKDIRRSLDDLPEGLQETYENILQKIDPHHANIVKKTLGWLVCDVSTMTLAHLFECLAIEEGIDHIDEEAQLSSPMDIYDLCGGLVTATSGGEVVLAHLSVRDYLLSKTIKTGKASGFALSLLEVNKDNAMKCLTYLSFAEFRNGPSQTMHDFEAHLISHPFLEHAAKCWTSYTMYLKSPPEELKAEVLKLFTPENRPQFMSWLQFICSEAVVNRQDFKLSTLERRKSGFYYYPKHATSLYYAASFGIDYVVTALLEQGAEVDATGGRVGATAFHAAALRGHMQIMELLLQKGADPNKVDIVEKTPLHSAVLGNHLKVIWYLLSCGANPNITDDRNRTAYDWACMMDHKDAQKLLKDATIVKEEETNAQGYESEEYELISLFRQRTIAQKRRGSE